MHLPIVAFPQLGHGKVVSFFSTRRTPQDVHSFSWPITLFDLGAEV